MKQSVLLVLVLTLSFCSGKRVTNLGEAELAAIPNEQKELNNDTYEASNALTSKIELGTFSTTPDELDGCGCAFFQSEQDWQNQSYIFADAGDVACVKIDGELQLLDFISYNEATSVITYSNERYKLTRESIKSSPSKEEETTNVEAIITLTRGADKVVEKVVGYCGC